MGDVAAILWRLPSTLDDPKLAWPTQARHALPGPVGMHAALVLVLTIPAALAGVVVGRRLRWDRRLQHHGTQWAGRWRLRRLIVL